MTNSGSRLPTARLLIFLTLCIASGLVTTSARAESPAETGKAHFERGVKLYNLGHFQESIGEFEKAYDIDPAPILLFNIAQSHRQLGEKERALFFYRRYLEQAPKANNRADVEQRMKDLAQSLEQEKELKQRPPTEVERGAPPPAPVTVPSLLPAPGVPVVTATPPVVEAPASAAESESRRWAAAAYLAPSVVGFSSTKDISAPVLFSARLSGSYALPVLDDRLMVGLDAVVSFLPYTAIDQTSKGSSSFWGFLLTARYLYPVNPKLSVGGGLGAGVIWWAGLQSNNPFTVEGVPASGAIPMPTAQVGLRAEYRLSKGFFVVLAPEFLVSATTSAGLSTSVSAVERFDIDIGAGYSF